MYAKFDLTTLLATTLFYLNATRQSINTSSLKTSIDSFIVNKMTETGIVAKGAKIIIDKKLVWKNGYGYTDKEKKFVLHLQH